MRADEAFSEDARQSVHIAMGGFAFALNNQHLVEVRWFFGYKWQAPMVFIVLVVFSAARMGQLGNALGRFFDIAITRGARVKANLADAER